MSRVCSILYHFFSYLTSELSTLDRWTIAVFFFFFSPFFLNDSKFLYSIADSLDFFLSLLKPL